MKWSIIGLIGIGIVAALSSAVLVASIQSGGAKPTRLDPRDRMVTLFVANRDMNELTRVNHAGLEERSVHASEAPAGVLSSTEQIVGQILAMPVMKGQPFTRRCFAPQGPGKNLASLLRPGMRAISLPLAATAGMQGLLYPGSVVDVLASFRISAATQGGGRALSTTLLQGIPVLAVENETVADPAKDDSTSGSGRKASVSTRLSSRLKVTLMVTSRQAEALQLATEYGTVSLIMRNPTDAARTDEEATLLHEGRLAKLAEFLGSSVADDTGLRRGEPEPEPAATKTGGLPSAFEQTPPPAVVEEKPVPAPTWDVTILRGDKIEVQTFVLPDSGDGERTTRLEK